MTGSEQDCGEGAADAYDVVLSFSPQDRKSVDILALELSRRGIRIFRDETPEAVAWGVRLGASIPPPQGVRSRYGIVQLEPEKARRLWGAGEAGDEAGPADSPVPDPSISYLCCPPESVSTIADRVSRELRRVAARTVPRIWRVPMTDGTRPGHGVPVFEDRPPGE